MPEDRTAEPTRVDPPALRRLVLAVAVLDDLPVEPTGQGAALRDGPPLEVGWAELAAAAGDASLEGALARRRVARHLRGRRLVAGTPVTELARRARPLGHPVGAGDHPGADWVRERPHGGALELGLGFAGVGADPDGVEVLPTAALAAAGLDRAAAWRAAREYLERMGHLAADRLRRDPGGVLRPMGDCDVVTLLGSATFRRAVAAGDGSGMRAVAVPMRRRGWVDLARIDPAFVRAAAAATADADRGFERPLLVTADEVVLAGDGRPAQIVLRDPAVGAYRGA